MPFALLDVGTTKLAAGFGESDVVREILRVPLPTVVFDGVSAMQPLAAFGEVLDSAVRKLQREVPVERWDALVLVGQRGTGIDPDGRLRSWLDRSEGGLCPRSLVAWAAERLCGQVVDTLQTGQIVASSVPRVPAGSVVGKLASGVPLVLGGGDKNAEHWGAGVFEPRVAALSLGTAFSLGVVSQEPASGDVFASPSARSGWVHVEVGIPWGGGLFPWADRMFGPPKALRADSPLFYPYLRGALDDPHATASWSGLDHPSEPGEFSAAVREGIGFELRRLRCGLPMAFDRIRTTGGADADAFACQSIADALETTVEQLDERAANATLVGAYAIGRHALAKPWEPRMTVSRVFSPAPFASERFQRWSERAPHALRSARPTSS